MLYLTEKEKAILTAVQQIRQGRLIPKTCLVCNAPIEQSYNGGHVRRYCKKAIGKLTEGWTDFARKGGNLHGRVEIDTSMPGKIASHQVYFSLNM